MEGGGGGGGGTVVDIALLNNTVVFFLFHALHGEMHLSLCFALRRPHFLHFHVGDDNDVVDADDDVVSLFSVDLMGASSEEEDLDTIPATSTTTTSSSSLFAFAVVISSDFSTPKLASASLVGVDDILGK